MQRFRHAVIPTAVLAAALAGSPVWAQGAAQGTGAAPAPAAPAVVQPSEAQLEQYATTAQKIAALAESYQPKVMAATDDNSRQQLIAQADEEMVRTVQSDGMTVEEYNGISEAVQRDPQLQQRLVQMVETQNGGSSPAP